MEHNGMMCDIECIYDSRVNRGVSAAFGTTLGYGVIWLP